MKDAAVSVPLTSECSCSAACWECRKTSGVSFADILGSYINFLKVCSLNELLKLISCFVSLCLFLPILFKKK